ncbi:MAG: hypothetical protein HeimC3_30720 [Candidatus Heimdallarchaeota archaeon LC_3]|nr:MAG: hypothetical protein HeimC3_30720 [Candidatus Heimdallarchaeota archaeon LC_3]
MSLIDEILDSMNSSEKEEVKKELNSNKTEEEIIEIPSDKSLSDLILESMKKTGKNKKEINPEIDQYLTKRANFENLLEPENTNPDFINLFEEVLGQISSTSGMQIRFVDGELEHSEDAIKTSIYRPDDKYINELIEYINDSYNPSCKIHPLPFDYEHPNPKIINIDPEGEICNKVVHHASYDAETNIFQHLYPETIKTPDSKEIKISGGVLGVHYLEAQRYIEFKVNYDTKGFVTFKNAKDSGYTVLVEGSNPLEAIFLSVYEAIVAVILISAMQDGQKELISIFDEITADFKVPLNSQILEDYLYHRINLLNIGANVKFDIGQILAAHQKAKKKLDFLITDTEPKEIRIMWGKIEEREEMFIKTYNVRLGNRTVGFRYKIRHNKKFGKLGKPELAIAPAQAHSDKISYATDIKTLAKTCLYERASLEYIAKGTAFEKKKELMNETDMQFWHLLSNKNDLGLL